MPADTPPPTPLDLGAAACPKCGGPLGDGAHALGSPRYRFCLALCGYQVRGEAVTLIQTAEHAAPEQPPAPPVAGGALTAEEREAIAFCRAEWAAQSWQGENVRRVIDGAERLSAAVVGPAALTLEESGNAEYAINHCHPSDEQAVVARAALRLSAALATAEAQAREAAAEVERLRIARMALLEAAATVAREAAARVGVLERALAVSEAKGQAAHDALVQSVVAEDAEHAIEYHASELPTYYRQIAAAAEKARCALEMTDEEVDAFEARVAAPTPPAPPGPSEREARLEAALREAALHVENDVKIREGEDEEDDQIVRARIAEWRALAAGPVKA